MSHDDFKAASCCKYLQRWLEHLHSLLLSQASNCFLCALPKSVGKGCTWVVLTTDGDSTYDLDLRVIDVTSLKSISSIFNALYRDNARVKLLCCMGMQMQRDLTLSDCHLRVSYFPQYFVNYTCGWSIRPASIPAEYNAVFEPAPHCFSSTLQATDLAQDFKHIQSLPVQRHCPRCLTQHTTLLKVHGKRSLKVTNSIITAWHAKLLISWKERCREAQIHPPVFQIVSDRRGNFVPPSSQVRVCLEMIRG